MQTPIGSNGILGVIDLMDSYAVKVVLKNSFARMRRPAYGEKFSISLPAYFYDFYKIATKYLPNVLSTPQLPMGFTYTSDVAGVFPTSTYTPPTFNTVKVGQEYSLAFPMQAYIGVDGQAFNNDFSITMKPVIVSSAATTTLHPYLLLNKMLHRAIIQPGMLLMPIFYHSELSKNEARAYGPLLLTSANIRGAENSPVEFSLSFKGTTSLAASWTPSSYILNEIKVPTREVGVIDTVVLIGNEADIYFDSNNLFNDLAFEFDYLSDTESKYYQSDINQPKKRVIDFSLKVNNTYAFSRTMPANSFSVGGTTEFNKFSSSDAAGERYAILNGRTVTGDITFVADRISDFDLNFTTDNDSTNRLIISVAPHYHFPLTDVQFSVGTPEYTPEKTVRVKYNFVARVATNTFMSLQGSLFNAPSSEFGYAYSLNNNALYGAS